MNTCFATPLESSHQFGIMVDKVKDYAIFLTDEYGIIRSWNEAAEAMKGYSADEVLGKHLSMLYTPEDRAAGAPEHNLGEAAVSGTFQEKGWRVKKDGTRFWAMIELIALHSPGGRLKGFCKITRDISDMKTLQNRLTHEHERAEATLGAIGDAVISVQADGRVDYLNPKAEELTGWHIEDAAGASLHGVLARLGPAAISKEEAALTGRESNGSPALAVMQSRGGAHHIIESTTSPIFVSGNQVGEVIVFRDVEAQLEAECALRDADRRKDEFLAMLAHELRNPLAPVSAAAELLSMARLDSAGIRKASQVIIRQVRHMRGLVDDLLDVSRVTRGLVSIVREPQDLKSVVAEAIEQVRPAIEAKHHALLVRLPREAAHVLGDHNRLIQIFANLLNNAAKYTPPGGEVQIEMQFEAGLIVTRVIDNGIGITPKLQAHVFELFEQAERSSDRVQGGLGIGLALVRTLTEQHGGTASCASAGPRAGSTFTVALPAIAAKGLKPERRTSLRELPVAQGDLRILIVDDNADAADMLSFYLETSGYLTESAHSGADALTKCEATGYDVCILDIGLPEMNGHELARTILANAAGRPPVLIALTGYGHARDRELAEAAGFSYHLVKPANLHELHDILTVITLKIQGSGL